MFKNAIVRIPGQSVVDGIDDYAQLGKPDYATARQEHAEYVKALESLGVTVTVLSPIETMPDSCFVEDPAVVSTGKFAVITSPAKASRNPERDEILPAIEKVYDTDHIFYIKSPATMEGGDVMQVGDTIYVGLSERTNQAGIDQFKKIAEPFGYTVVAVPVKQVLHLKTGVTYMGNNKLLVSGEYIDHPLFAAFDQLKVPADEAYAVNCIANGNTVLMPAGFPKVKQLLTDAGFNTTEANMSEFEKIDGGLTCLSLRYWKRHLLGSRLVQKSILPI